MKDALRPAVVALLVFTAIFGLAYPMLMIVVARVIPHPPPSELVGHTFDDPADFWGRPTNVTNLAVTSPALAALGRARVDALHAIDPTNTAPVPVDLVSSSASGLDPHISPEAARYQVPRIARLRGRSVQDIEKLVDEHVEPRTLGIFGEARVNVLLLNRALHEH